MIFLARPQIESRISILSQSNGNNVFSSRFIPEAILRLLSSFARQSISQSKASNYVALVLTLLFEPQKTDANLVLPNTKSSNFRSICLIWSKIVELHRESRLSRRAVKSGK